MGGVKVNLMFNELFVCKNRIPCLSSSKLPQRIFFVFFPAVMVIGFFTTLVVRVIDNLAV